jgi:hypothetical protein
MFLSNLRNLYRLAKGKVSYRDISQRIRGIEVRSTAVAYIGYATRQSSSRATKAE